ncbi:ribosome recycling factor-domain-containing protein [Gloeopeniophorella convolvens]|nr:ribosome recycling factor-domain-containing protein [Gloeopeniophorella convolvens]
MSLLCHALRPSTIARIPARPLLAAALQHQQRPYAKKAKHSGSDSSADASKRAPVATASLTPGSQRGLADPAAREEHARAAARMAASVEWFQREVAQREARASGRVTPQLLAPVRVTLPGGGAPARLEDVATVGVREGTTLVVTVFEPENLKHVQDALYEAKIQGVIPQRVDERTLKIPIPRPTVEARLAAYTSAARQAEETRVQIRRHHQASVKKGKYGKHSAELDEFSKLQDKHIADVDAILAQLKKSTGAR